MISNQYPQSRFVKTVLQNILDIIKNPPESSGLSTGMTQKELAEIMGITPPVLSKILKKGNPTLETIWQLSVALQVDPVVFFKGTEKEKMEPMLAEMKKQLEQKKG